jgi:hypothetical protein
VVGGTVHRLEQASAREIPFCLEPGKQDVPGWPVDLGFRPKLAAQMLKEHVKITNGAGRRAEIAKPFDEHLLPLSIQGPACGADERPHAPSGDAMLMKVLRVQAEAGARVMHEQRLPLRLKHLTQADRTRIGARRRRRDKWLGPNRRVNQG